MRKRLGLLVIGTVILLVVGVGALVGRSLWQQSKQDPVRTALEFLPGVSQHIQDFHRVKLKDGRKVWEVSAQDAQYREEEGKVLVRSAMVQLYLKDGRTIGLKGEEAEIQLAGRDIMRVELAGGIEVTLADYIVRTDRATYNDAQQTITTAGPVEISGRALQLRGDRMDVEVPAHLLRLHHNVSMRLEPAKFGQGGRDAPL